MRLGILLIVIGSLTVLGHFPPLVVVIVQQNWSELGYLLGRVAAFGGLFLFFGIWKLKRHAKKA